MILELDENQLTQLYMDDGLPERDAREAAREVIKNTQTMRPGVEFGGIDLHEIPILITRANRAQVRSLTITIECAGEQYQWHDYTLKVLHAQRWGEPTEPTLEQQIRAKITDIETNHAAILERHLENIVINAPVALQQINLKARLEELYALLGETPPPYPCYQS
jgi:hypothetical protein